MIHGLNERCHFNGTVSIKGSGSHPSRWTTEVEFGVFAGGLLRFLNSLLILIMYFVHTAATSKVIACIADLLALVSTCDCTTDFSGALEAAAAVLLLIAPLIHLSKLNFIRPWTSTIPAGVLSPFSGYISAQCAVLLIVYGITEAS